jgi:hypothetical protein
MKMFRGVGIALPFLTLALPLKYLEAIKVSELIYNDVIMHCLILVMIISHITFIFESQQGHIIQTRQLDVSWERTTRWGRFLEKDVVNWKAERKRSVASRVTTYKTQHFSIIQGTQTKRKCNHIPTIQ